MMNIGAIIARITSPINASRDAVVSAITSARDAIVSAIGEGAAVTPPQPTSLGARTITVTANQNTEVAPANPARHSISLSPTVDCWIGGADISPVNGFLLQAQQPVTLTTTAAIYIRPVMSGSVYLLEEGR